MWSTLLRLLFALVLVVWGLEAEAQEVTPASKIETGSVEESTSGKTRPSAVSAAEGKLEASKPTKKEPKPEVSASGEAPADKASGEVRKKMAPAKEESVEDPVVIEGRTKEAKKKAPETEKREKTMVVLDPSDLKFDRENFVNSLGMEMIWVETESSEVGGFWVSKYEVTQDEYEKVRAGFSIKFPMLLPMRENPSKFKGEALNPVENVRWQDAIKFCLALTELEKSVEEEPSHPGQDFTYSLPDAEQWLIFSAGATPNPVDSEIREQGPRRVGESGEPSALGLCDLLGNVSEWCLDRYYPAINADADLVARFPALFSPIDGARAVCGATELSVEEANPFLSETVFTRSLPDKPDMAGNVGFRVILKWGGVRGDQQVSADSKDVPDSGAAGATSDTPEN